jgi:uncharacterized protein YjbJ (UPF0337 family)
MTDRNLRREGLEDRIEGTFEEKKGKVRGDIGDALDNQSEHLKGRAQQVRGKVQKKVGEAKEELSERDASPEDRRR